ncbi:MAG: hypothetical protein WCN95_02235 [bacterium]
MRYLKNWQTGLSIALLVVTCLSAPGEGFPDLLKGETNRVDRKLTDNLGPTGLRGWIYAK